MKTNDAWGTPKWVVDIARRVMGSIDLDPCSSPAFNETVQAKTFYTRDDDGLTKPWHGNVLLNPPSGKGVPNAFAHKASRSVYCKHASAVFYVGFNLSHLRVCYDLAAWPIAILRNRICFNNEDGTPGSAPMRDNFFSIMTRDSDVYDRFVDQMHRIEAGVFLPRGWKGN